ncbi:MAG: DUF4388 domain-containing protein [Fibrobacterota bacterium]|nr:DUF4388 domain-containing protein [Fibrobacterota bacterium]
MTTWLLLLSGVFAALALGGFFLWRHLSPRRHAMDVNRVQRLTDKFPAILRSAPEPVIKTERNNAGLQGNLGQTPLHDLLQYLALGRKSGILELVSGRRTGRIILKDGRVYKDSYRGMDGLEAMFMMMDLAEGDFEFYEQTLEDSVTYSGLEVVDIIMLWMDRKPKKKA